MIKCDYHVHTCFSDGHHTPEEVAESALKMGMEELGFSDHSFSPQDVGYSWSMPVARYSEYVREIQRLKEKYKGKLRILCGMEQDLDSPPPPDGLDYMIGSVHYLNPEGHPVPVDAEAAFLQDAIQKYYSGDPYAMCEDYYHRVSLLKTQKINIIGHFDLISKFNEKTALFDENHPRYKKAQQDALLALLPLHIPFEINTGAISRGYRTTPYPCIFVRDTIRQNGGTLLLSSDSHHRDTLMFQFERWEDMINN